MRLQEPITRHGVNDRLLLHQILAISLSARKLSGWEAPSSLLLWLHPMACGLVARIHLTLTKHKRPSTCLLAGLLAAFLIFAPSFLGLFFFNSGGLLVTNVEAVGL